MVRIGYRGTIIAGVAHLIDICVFLARIVYQRAIIGIVRQSVAVGVIILFRPLIPTLPFKVGNTVRTGDLLGKIEATTILNTRMRTFDGKTFFVPNRKILDDIVINYHFTKTRRIKIDVGIRYDQDLMKAKQLDGEAYTEKCDSLLQRIEVMQ